MFQNLKEETNAFISDLDMSVKKAADDLLPQSEPSDEYQTLKADSVALRDEIDVKLKV